MLFIVVVVATQKALTMVFPCSSLCFRGIVHSQTRKAQAQHCGDLRKLKRDKPYPFFSSLFWWCSAKSTGRLMYLIQYISQ